MTISITLPPDTEKRLRAEADAAGKDIGTFVVEAVEARLSLGKLNLRDVLSPVHEDLRKSGMTDAELDAYLATRQWEGCSGAYAIQEKDDPYVRVVRGSLSNVVGLPMETLERVLAMLL